MHPGMPESLRRSDDGDAFADMPASPNARVSRRPGVQPGMTAAALLQVWLSPSFPVGAFAYSHGLEQAVERHWVRDRSSLEAWIADLARHGSLGNDLILLAEAWHAATAGQWDRLADVAQLSAALQPSAERHLEATQQGRSFVDAVAAAWPCAVMTRLRDSLDEGAGASAGGAGTSSAPVAAAEDGAPAAAEIGYPVAVGAAAAGHAIALADTLLAYAVAFAGNLTSAAIRLGVIGQTDGQRVIAALLPLLHGAAARAAASSRDDLGGAAFRSDLASLAHETQYSRLFRS